MRFFGDPLTHRTTAEMDSVANLQGCACAIAFFTASAYTVTTPRFEATGRTDFKLHAAPVCSITPHPIHRITAILSQPHFERNKIFILLRLLKKVGLQSAKRALQREYCIVRLARWRLQV